MATRYDWCTRPWSPITCIYSILVAGKQPVHLSIAISRAAAWCMVTSSDSSAQCCRDVLHCCGALDWLYQSDSAVDLAGRIVSRSVQFNFKTVKFTRQKFYASPTRAGERYPFMVACICYDVMMFVAITAWLETVIALVLKLWEKIRNGIVIMLFCLH